MRIAGKDELVKNCAMGGTGSIEAITRRKLALAGFKRSLSPHSVQIQRLCRCLMLIDDESESNLANCPVVAVLLATGLESLCPQTQTRHESQLHLGCRYCTSILNCILKISKAQRNRLFQRSSIYCADL